MLRIAILTLLIAVPVAAADWPQFLGPERNGVYAGPDLNEKWLPAGPRVVWRRTIGDGLAGPVVAQNRVILFHRVDDREVVESLDARLPGRVAALDEVRDAVARDWAARRRQELLDAQYRELRSRYQVRIEGQ